jgi:uncharacterized membrane protein
MRKWIPLLIIIAAAVVSATVYPRLPESVPTHWDISGHPNGWSSRFWGAWLLPIILVVVWAFMSILPKIDPRGSNYAKFGGAFEGMIIAIMLFLFCLHIVALRAALGHPVAMNRVLPIAMGVLFVVIGILLPSAEPNWFVGIRTPWTLSSDRVWRKTHEFGGKAFVMTGLVILVAGLVIPDVAHIVLFVAVVICTIGVLAYSYLEWKREQANAQA